MLEVGRAVEAARDRIAWLRRDPPAALTEPPALPPVVVGAAGLRALSRRRSLRPFASTDRLLAAALDDGPLAIDTAAVYGGGAAERAVGHFVRSRRVRERVVLIGKGGHPHQAGTGRLDPTSLASDLDASLRRLRTDVIDIYMLHRDDPSVEVGPVMQTLHRFVQAGKVRALGASNWTHQRIEAANLAAAAHGLTPFSCSSPHFGLAAPVEPPWPGCVSIAGDDGGDARAWYAATGMPVLAWSPLSGGFLTGSRHLDPALARAYDSEPNAERRARLAAFAAARSLSAAQVGIAYARSAGFTVHPIVAAAPPDRLRPLVQAAQLRLSPDECAWLDLRVDTPLHELASCSTS